MRTLILSCNTGEGHNSCAKAIKEVYDAKGEVCRIEDALGFISKRVSRFVSGWHTRIYRYCPGWFRRGYGYSEQHPVLFQEYSWVYRLLTKGVEELCRLICEEKYDTVICTHVFPALMVTEMRKRYPALSLRAGFVATDYTCSPSTETSDLDVYFIPDDTLAEEFVQKGVPGEKLVGSGIPVRQMFCRNLEKEAAKRRLHILPGQKHLLMMCGSMGCGPMARLASALAERMEEHWVLTIVCGTNRRLYGQLSRRFASLPNVHVQGYVADMSALMDSADLYLTKPGGISVTEAAGKCLPMVFIDAVAGCEEYNKQYFLAAGGAAAGTDVNDLAAACCALLAEDAAREEMAEALSRQRKENAAAMIYHDMTGART